MTTPPLTDLIPLHRARDLFGFRAPSVPTLYRWTTTGVRGVRLRTWQVGSVRCTTRAAVEEFVGTLTELRDHQQPADRAPACVRRRKEVPPCPA